MASFNLKKGNKFSIDKGIRNVTVGCGWKINSTSTFDVDLSVFGCTTNALGNPVFFNEGSHAVTYANSSLKKGPNNSLLTEDGSIAHTGDNRVGTSANTDAEQDTLKLGQIHAGITEISFFITIYEAKKRRQTFGAVNDAYIRVTDSDTNEEICRYNLTKEFSDSISIQVGSLVRDTDTGNWSFSAIGAGSGNEGLGELLEKLS